MATVLGNTLSNASSLPLSLFFFLPTPVGSAIGKSNDQGWEREVHGAMMKWIKEVKNELNNQKDQYLLRKERGRHSEVPAESERACASVLWLQRGRLEN